jgi:hypothetical protein
MRGSVNEARDRKARSERRLVERGVLINSHLPVIESVDEARLRVPHVVAERALALFAVALHCDDPQGLQAHRFLHQEELWRAITPKERAFLLLSDPPQSDLVQFSWRNEALIVLLWALNHVQVLTFPDAPCDLDIATEVIRRAPIREFIDTARLRAPDQILDEADFIFRCHWAVVEAGLHGQEPTGNLDADVVYERHYALNWLVGYLDQEWDDVSTDT